MKRALLLVLAALFVLSFPVRAEEPDQAQIDFANGLFQRKFYKEAVEEYQNYLKQYPQGKNVPTALYRLGEAAYAAQQYEPALDAFNKFLAGEADPALKQRATMSRAEVLYFLKRPADAALAIEPLTSDKVPLEIRTRALYFFGKINTESKNYDAALNAFKKLTEIAPENSLAPYARFQTAFVRLQRGELEPAAVELSAIASSNAEPGLRAEARFRAAEAYDKLGWFDAAVTAYKQLQDESPGSTYVQYSKFGCAWALYHAGKYAEAAGAAQTLLQENAASPDAAGMQYLLANCLQQQQKYDEAAAKYREIIDKYKDSPFVAKSHYKIGWCLYLTGKINEAKAEVSAFLQTPGDPALVGDAAFLLGTIMAAQGDYESAYDEFRLVAEKYPDSEFGAEALFKGGECVAQLGRTDEAAKIFEEFAQKYPSNPLTEQAIDAAVNKYKKILEKPADATVEQDTLYRLAITYHNMKNYQASAETFQKYLEKYSTGSRASEARVRCGDYFLRDAKDAVKAIEFYNAALNAEPKGEFAGRALKGVALARYETKDYDAACDLFLRLMTEFPTVTLNEDSYAWVGEKCFDAQKWEQAALAFRSLLAAKPDYANPERVRMKIAQCFDASGKAKEAMEAYQAVVNAAPKSASAVEARFNIAQIQEKAGKADEAFKMFEEVANTNTGDTAARARFHLGELSEAKNDFDAAARSYMRVAILFLHEKLSPESLWRAGQCFEKAGSADQAKKSYEELIRDYPDSQQAANAKQALAKLG
jgi:TolA-binding protein